MKSVVGLYDRFDDAQQAVRDLRDAGFHSEDISMVSRDAKGEYAHYLPFQKTEGQSVAEGAAEGAGVGAVIGGLGGLLVGLAALTIPGIGPVLAAGPLVAALAGAGAGVVAGGIIGGLVDLGIPEEHAQYYAEGVRRGGTLVVVRADDMLADQAMNIMNRHNPVDIAQRAEDWRRSNWMGWNPSAEPLTEDQMEFNRLGDRSNVPVTGAEQPVDYDPLDRQIPGTDVTNRDVMNEQNTEFNHDLGVKGDYPPIDENPENQ